MIIGIVGFIGSGKNTVSNYIVNNYNFEQHSFASNLKDILSILFLWDRELLEGETLESRIWREEPDIWWENKLNWINSPIYTKFNKRFTPRFVSQYIGTNLFRDMFNNNIWVLSLEKKIKDVENCVITDCRFRNEIAFIRQQGGKIVRVKRGPEPDWYDIALEFNKGQFNTIPKELIDIHPSEWAWIGTEFDYIFENDLKLVELEKEVKCWIDTLAV